MSAGLIAIGKVGCTMANTTSSPRGNVMTGSLSEDFLRIDGQPGVQMIGGQQMAFGGFQPNGGVLTMTIVQARLAKNYGMTRMDPYCRIRVGVQVYETPTAYNGSKNPRWMKMIQCQLPEGVKDFYFEIFDERTFQVDERIAWGMVSIKDEVFNGESVDDWYSLSGKQGDEKEGVVNIVIQYRKSNGPVMMGGPMLPGGAVMYPTPMMYPGGSVVYGYQQPMIYSQTTPMMQPFPQQPQGVAQQQQQQIQQQPPAANPKDLAALKEMCPNIDDDIIREVLQQSGGNVDRAAATLLEMSGDSAE